MDAPVRFHYFISMDKHPPGPLIYSIDFGTSNSLLGAASAAGTVPPIPLDPHAPDPSVLRSVIYFGQKDDAWFGAEAIRHYLQGAEENAGNGRLMRSFKRFLPIKSVASTTIGARVWKLDDLIARFLREMRERANRHFGKDVESAVLGRPALFAEDPEADQIAQDRLESAAKKAGFKWIEFLPEPVAAAYRYRLEMAREEKVLVADFGGGTSDFTVLKLSKREFKPTDVLAIGGAPVAGDALDGAIMRFRVMRNFGSEVTYQVPFGKNTLTMPKALMANLISTAHIHLLTTRENQEFLRRVEEWSLGDDDQRTLDQLKILLENQLGFSVFEAIEKAKRELSAAERTEVAYEYPGIRIREPMTNPEFREYSQHEVQRIFGALDETLSKAGVKASEIDRVCCTGGTAKASVVRHELLKRFEEGRLDNFRNFSSIVEGLSERAKQLT